MSSQFSLKKRFQSMTYAINGLKILWREQHNCRVHLFVTALVLVFGLMLSISATQWILLLLLIALVWVAEALNTAVEYLCDKVTMEHDPLIGKAKDVAAAGVLIASIIAAVGGLLLFLPAVFEVFV